MVVILLKLLLTAILFKELYSTPQEMEDQDLLLIGRLHDKDETAFETVYKKYFQTLYAYALSIVKNEMMAEEIVQNVFYKIWEKASSLNFRSSLVAYLFRAIYNESLNHLKHLKVRSENKLHIIYRTDISDETASNKIQVKELELKLQSALNELPEQCRTVFQLSRFEELRYREIADKLQISIKTVENHMGKALKLLRAKLIDYLPLLLLLINFKKGFK